MTNLVNRVNGRATRASMKPLALFKTSGGPLPPNVHHPARGAVHSRVCHGPARGAIEPGVGHGPARRPHDPTLQHPAGRLLPLQGTAGGLVPSKLCASLSVAVRCAGIAVNQGIACQPFGDVLIVGRRPALVRAVMEEPREKDGQGALVTGKGFLCVGSGALIGTVRSQVW